MYGDPAYGHGSIGFEEPMISDDIMGEFYGMNDLDAKNYLDDINKKYAVEDKKYVIENNILNQRSNEIRDLMYQTNHAPYRRNDEGSSLLQLEQELDDIIDKKNALSAKADDATIEHRMRVNGYDHHIAGTRPDFNVNTRTLIFENKERLPGYGEISHTDYKPTLGHVYVTESNLDPDTVIVTQIQSDLSQQPTFTKAGVEKGIADAELLKIAKGVQRDIQKLPLESWLEPAKLAWVHIRKAIVSGKPYEDYSLQLKELEEALGRPVFSEEFKVQFDPNKRDTPYIGGYDEMMTALPDIKAFQKTNYDRMVQETVSWAAHDGYKKVKFPTAQTASNIQYYGNYFKKSVPTSEGLNSIKILDSNPLSPKLLPDWSEAIIVNHLDITKNKVSLAKDLTEVQKRSLLQLFANIENIEFPLSAGQKPGELIEKILNSDKPLWEYVPIEATDVYGRSVKKGKEFKSDFFTESQVDSIKKAIKKGERIIKHVADSEARGVNPLTDPDRYKLLGDVRSKIVMRYEEDIPKILKKRYPGAKIERVTDSKGQTWWIFTLPEDVLKGERPIIAHKLGGSVEANLSPEDVQRYINGGYILEEIN